MNRLLAILLLSVLFPSILFSQVTKVKGKVTDAQTGEPVQAAAVFFQGSYVGTMTDKDGSYKLETKDKSLNVLSVRIIGYEDLDAGVPSILGDNVLDLTISPKHTRLSASVVKPDNHRVIWLLDQIDRNKDRNNPEKLPCYQCSVYNKMEVDVVDPENNIGFAPIMHGLPSLKSYIDSSDSSRRPVLPSLLSESVIRRYHSSNPISDNEVIVDSRVSGFNDGNALSQLTGTLRQTMNFYDGHVHIGNIEIPSPASRTAYLYYNHYIVDSLDVDGRKTYLVHFHPKKLVSQPCLDGEMEVDASEFALKAVRGQLHPGSDVNWVRMLSVDIENTRLADSCWFYKDDGLEVELSIAVKDSLSAMSFAGRRNIHYSNPSFEPMIDSVSFRNGYNTVMANKDRHNDESWWNSARPVPLNQREAGIYGMVESVQESRTYKFWYTAINMFATGYAEFGKIGYGPYYGLFSWNDTEGFRTSLGLRTTKEFSRKVRLTGYAAYGFKDEAVKGGVSMERVFSNLPMKKLTVTAKSDVVQLGRSEDRQGGSMFSSMLSKGNGDRMSIIRKFDVQYEHELTRNVIQTFTIGSQRIYSNAFVPMLLPDGTSLPFVSTSQLRLTTRFSWKETVTRGVFDNQRIFTRFPVVTLDLNGSVKGLDKNSCSFFRPELTVRYKAPTPPLGVMKVSLNAGHIFGEVPYPLLKMYEGNQTYFFDANAFSCLNYYEFVSDSWATLFYEQNLRGAILGKIPLLRALDLREVLSFRAACGSLSDRNDHSSVSATHDGILFPEGMSSLGKPYAEIGCGIANIFSLFRVDCFWRLTHRYVETGGVKQKSPSCFAFNVCMELNF